MRGRSDRGSSGLGLDIARRVAEAGGGAMTVGASCVRRRADHAGPARPLTPALLTELSVRPHAWVWAGTKLWVALGQFPADLEERLTLW